MGRVGTRPKLARRGYVVRGIDRSPDLIEVAKGASDGSIGGVSFAVGNLAELPIARYDGILCRGVLNDIIDDGDRGAAFRAFGQALRFGALILDVREWAASAQRKTREPLFRKRVSTERGDLTFTSVTTLDPENRELRSSERHELVGGGGTHVSEYQFVMRGWECDELGELLVRHGFENVSYFGAYDPGIESGATDRIVAVAQLTMPLAADGGWCDAAPPRLKRQR